MRTSLSRPAIVIAIAIFHAIEVGSIVLHIYSSRRIYCGNDIAFEVVLRLHDATEYGFVLSWIGLLLSLTFLLWRRWLILLTSLFLVSLSSIFLFIISLFAYI